MPHCSGWFPRRRDGIIHRAGAGDGQVDLHGLARGIPQELIARFKNQPAAAKALLSEVKSAGRNSVNTGQCRIAFRELELTMQFLKANYFNSPPRTADEIIALLLALHDGGSTPILPLHNTDGHGMLVKLFTGPPWRKPLRTRTC